MYKTARQSEPQENENEEDGDTPFISQPIEKEENPLQDRRFLEMNNVVFDRFKNFSCFFIFFHVFY